MTSPSKRLRTEGDLHDTLRQQLSAISPKEGRGVVLIGTGVQLAKRDLAEIAGVAGKTVQEPDAPAPDSPNARRVRSLGGTPEMGRAGSHEFNVPQVRR